MFDFSSCASRGRNFADNTNGNIAMLFSLCLLPFMAMIGLAVDINAASSVRNKLQASLDSALIAAARESIDNASQQEVQAEIDAFMSAVLQTMPASVTCGSVTVTPANTAGEMSASIDCKSKTAIAGVVNKDFVDLELESEITFGIGKIDVAFVFDVSGSMDWASGPGYNQPSRMDALKSAASSAITQLLGSMPAGSDDVRLAMVGYNQAVNAGEFFEDATGLDPTRTYTYGDPDESGVTQVGTYLNHFMVALYDTRTNSMLGEIRDGTIIKVSEDQADHLAVAMTLRSDSFLVGNMGSAFLNLNWSSHTRTENASPYALHGDSNGDFYSGNIPTDQWNDLDIHAYSGANKSGWYYGYLDFDFFIEIAEASEITITNTCAYERNTAQWNTTDEPTAGHYLSAEDAVYNEDDGSWTVPSSCSATTPQPLTNNESVLQSYVTNLSPGGGTAGHLGLAWGRYLIAPEWSDVWPDASEPRGWDEPDTQKFIIMMTDGEFNSAYHWNRGTSFEQAQAHCDNAKAAGVKIFTIAFNAPQASATFLENCGSGEDFSFDASSSQELLDSYTAIVNRISDLRLSG